MNNWLRLWPASISAHAAEVDLVMALFLVLIVLLVVPVFVLPPYFIYKYRRGTVADRTGRPRGNPTIEFSWALFPLAAALVFFVWAAWLYVEAETPPDDALEITATPRQWMWKFQHPGGQREINELHVPAGRPIKLTMISQDVIHSLYLPALRIKQDVLPDRFTELWFQADETGVYHLLCTEYCGTAHSEMRGRIVVLEPAAYEAWLELSGTDMTLADRGGLLFRRLGCSGCHEDSDVVRAPSLAGVFGSPVPLASGEVVVADEQYIRDSILLPTKDIVAGYRPIMPSFEGRVGEEDLVALIAYVRSLATARDYREQFEGYQRDRVE